MLRHSFWEWMHSLSKQHKICNKNGRFTEFYRFVSSRGSRRDALPNYLVASPENANLDLTSLGKQEQPLPRLPRKSDSSPQVCFNAVYGTT